MYSTTEVSTTSQQQRFFSNYSMQNTGNWEVTAQIKSNKGYIALCPSTNGVKDEQGNTRYIGVGANTTNKPLSALGFTSDIDGGQWYTTGSDNSWNTSNYHTVKLVREGNLYSFYIDGALHVSTTSIGFGNYSPLYIFSYINGGGNFYLKEIKIKPL